MRYYLGILKNKESVNLNGMEFQLTKANPISTFKSVHETIEDVYRFLDLECMEKDKLVSVNTEQINCNLNPMCKWEKKYISQLWKTLDNLENSTNNTKELIYLF